ncbi:MAG: hypothetical protein Ct9H300mP27_10240 [Chloroflexota bacterium]|nr:MAG: hypothetical protein Ct9H300mP27_10240 [Chloroflexota bacterium]
MRAITSCYSCIPNFGRRIADNGSVQTTAQVALFLGSVNTLKVESTEITRP